MQTMMVCRFWRISTPRTGYWKLYREVAKITNKGEDHLILLQGKIFPKSPNLIYYKLLSVEICQGKSNFTFFLGKVKILAPLKDVQLSSQISNISTSFVTTEDLVEGKQWLRIDIQGA